MEVYRGSLRPRPGQYGSGVLGSLFSVLKRTAIPLIKKTAVPFLKKQAKRLAPKAASAGLNFLGDVVSKKRTFKDAARERGKQFLADAINTQSSKRPAQSKAGTGAARKKRKRVTTRRARDIFD